MAGFARGVIRAIDAILRRVYRVIEFTDDPECILRLARDRSFRDITLSNGTAIHVGDPVLNLHLFNERLPSQTSNSLGSGRDQFRRFVTSLQMLAAYVAQDQRASDVKAIYGQLSFATNLRAAREIFGRLGFDVAIAGDPRPRFWRRIYWENFYAYLLMWTYNPQSLRGKRLGDLRRMELWISRERLLSRYSP